MVAKIVIGVDGNIQDIYFYMPKPVPVSASGVLKREIVALENLPYYV